MKAQARQRRQRANTRNARLFPELEVSGQQQGQGHRPGPQGELEIRLGEDMANPGTGGGSSENRVEGRYIGGLSLRGFIPMEAYKYMYEII